MRNIGGVDARTASYSQTISFSCLLLNYRYCGFSRNVFSDEYLKENLGSNV